MANSYSQLLIQLVFAVKGRTGVIKENHREEVEKYICGIAKNKNCKPLAIYCNPDHCHILVGLHPTVSIAELAREVKANSSKWINKNNLVAGNFTWQAGYGAFSYSRSQLDNVVKYINNQPLHHKVKTFKEEYIELLQEFQIEYNKDYIF